MPLPHLHWRWAHPSHICVGTGLTPAISAPGLGSPPSRPFQRGVGVAPAWLLCRRRERWRLRTPKLRTIAARGCHVFDARYAYSMPILTQVAEAASALRAQLSYVSYYSLPPFLPSSLTRSLTRPLTHSHQPCATPLPPTAQRVVRTAVPAGQRFFDKSERRTHVVASATRTFSKQARFDSANARARIGPKWDRPKWDRPEWDRHKWDRHEWDRHESDWVLGRAGTTPTKHCHSH